MNTRNTPNVRRNFIYNVAYQVLLVISPLIVSPYISRVLGSENIGIYSYTYSIAQYFALFCALGVNNHGSRTIAVCRDDQTELNRTFSEIFTMKILVSSVMIAIYSGYIIFFVQEQYRLISIIQLLYIVAIVIDINWLFYGLEQFKTTVIRKVIVKIISVASIFIFVKNENDLVIYTAIMAGSYLVSEAYLWFSAAKKVSFVRPNVKKVFQHFKPMFVLFIPLLAVDLYRMMDKVMLGNMGMMSDVGQYENAEKIIMVCLGVVSALGTVMLPRMSKLNSENSDQIIRKYLKNSMNLIMCFCMGVAFGILAVGRNFAPLFFGVEYVECGKILQLLAISLVFIAWSNVIRTQYLIPCHREKVYIVAVWCGVAINLALNIILIPKNGAIGAAISTVATEIVVAVIQTIWIAKYVPIASFVKSFVTYFIMGLIMYCVIVLLENVNIITGVSLIVTQVVVGVVLYLCFVLAYLLIADRKSLNLIFGKIHKDKKS